MSNGIDDARRAWETWEKEEKMSNIEWSIEKLDKVKNLITEFIEKHNIIDGECIQQCDEPRIDSVNVMSKIVDIVKENE